MRAPNEVRPEELRDAHDAAHMLISERSHSDRPRIADELRDKARVS
jgi:hypothetical protein